MAHYPNFQDIPPYLSTHRSITSYGCTVTYANSAGEAWLANAGCMDTSSYDGSESSVTSFEYNVSKPRDIGFQGEIYPTTYATESESPDDTPAIPSVHDRPGVADGLFSSLRTEVVKDVNKKSIKDVDEKPVDDVTKNAHADPSSLAPPRQVATSFSCPNIQIWPSPDLSADTSGSFYGTDSDEPGILCTSDEESGREKADPGPWPAPPSVADYLAWFSRLRGIVRAEVLQEISSEKAGVKKVAEKKSKKTVTWLKRN